MYSLLCIYIILYKKPYRIGAYYIIHIIKNSAYL